MGLLPWEHATSGLCRKAAQEWLVKEGRQVKAVHIVEDWAVFYESPTGEARHQRWRPDPKDLDKLVLEGSHRLGWPISPG